MTNSEHVAVLAEEKTTEAANVPAIKSVVIDGVSYIPRDTVIPNAILSHLREIYITIGGELYDPYNAETEKFAQRLWEPIRACNAILGFKK